MAILWEGVARLMQYRALREAKAAQQILMYVQAIDEPKKGNRLTRVEYRRALQIVNMNKTGNRLGMCPLFVSMRVRLAMKLSAKFKIVQDAVGAIHSVIFDDREFASPDSDWRCDADHPARRCGFVRLRYMPRAVLVKFDDYDFDVGFGPGVVKVRPSTEAWEYIVPAGSGEARTMDKVPMSRTNVPLAPEKVRTVQTSQGMSMDAATMMLDRPSMMSYEDWWLHVYVMLSRVRTAKQIAVYGLPPKSLFEQGPPSYLVEGIENLERRCARQEAHLRQLAVSMGFIDVPMGAVLEAGLSDMAETQSGGCLHGARAEGDGLARETPAASAGAPSSAGHRRSAIARPSTRAPRAVPRRAPAASAKKTSSAAALCASSGLGDSVAAGFRSAARGSADADVAPLQKTWRLSCYDSDLSRRAPISGEVGFALLRALPVDLALTSWGVASDDLQRVMFYRDVSPAPRGLQNVGDTCFVSAVAQVFLRLEPIWKLLSAHASQCASGLRACKLCVLREQAAVLRGLGSTQGCILATWARQGRFGDAFLHGQCDAFEFWSALRDALIEQEPRPVQEADPDFDTRFGRRSALDEFVFGGVVRTRKGCAFCESTSDSLNVERFVQIPLHGKDHLSTLKDLWVDHFTQFQPLGAKCPLDDARVCAGHARQQQFFEREPPVLVIVLERAWEEWLGPRVISRGKVLRGVPFPQRLDFLRSGPYSFAGVVRHLGRSARIGHYTATCRLDDGYCHFDDLSARRVAWRDVASPAAQKEAYLLVYTREGSWSDAVRTGVECVPYVRGGDSLAILAMPSPRENSASDAASNVRAEPGAASSARPSAGAQESASRSPRSIEIAVAAQPRGASSGAVSSAQQSTHAHIGIGVAAASGGASSAPVAASAPAGGLLPKGSSRCVRRTLSCLPPTPAELEEGGVELLRSLLARAAISSDPPERASSTEPCSPRPLSDVEESEVGALRRVRGRAVSGSPAPPGRLAKRRAYAAGVPQPPFPTGGAGAGLSIPAPGIDVAQSAGAPLAPVHAPIPAAAVPGDSVRFSGDAGRAPDGVGELLFDKRPLVLSQCIRRVWQSQKTKPVFAQCPIAWNADTLYCRKHFVKEKDTTGDWDPPRHASLPAEKRAEGEREARRRRARQLASSADVPMPADLPTPISSRGSLGRTRGASAVSSSTTPGTMVRAVEQLWGDAPTVAANSVTGVGPDRVGHLAMDQEGAQRRISGNQRRIVKGFGSECVEDVARDEERRIAQGVRRGDRRREQGTRGRMVDFSGADLDRGAGGAWHAGRRST